MQTFVAKDYAALAELTQVQWANSSVGAGWRRGIGPTGWLPNRRLLRRIRESDVVFQWFAVPSAGMVGAWLLGKPAIVIAGGYDVASLPEIGYGRMAGRRTGAMGRLTLSLATRVLSISRSNLAEVGRAAPKARAELLYLGFRSVPTPPPAPSGHQVVTIGAISREYYERKGLDTFARTSRLVPDVPFTIIGRVVDEQVRRHLVALGGPNLTLTGYLERPALERHLGPNTVYAQLSLHEAFGCAVAEAMQRWCTPVVTRCGALPEVVGDAGYFAEPSAPESAARAIEQAFSRPLGERARERIETQFPWSARARRLGEVVREVLR